MKAPPNAIVVSLVIEAEHVVDDVVDGTVDICSRVWQADRETRAT